MMSNNNENNNILPTTTNSFIDGLSEIFQKKLISEFKISNLLHLENLIEELTKVEADVKKYEISLNISELKSNQQKHGTSTKPQSGGGGGAGASNITAATPYTNDDYMSFIIDSEKNYQGLKRMYNKSIELDTLTKADHLDNVRIVKYYQESRPIVGNLTFIPLPKINSEQMNEKYQKMFDRYMQILYILITLEKIMVDDARLNDMQTKKNEILNRKTSSTIYRDMKFKQLVYHMLFKYKDIFKNYSFSIIKSQIEIKLTERKQQFLTRSTFEKQ